MSEIPKQCDVVVIGGGPSGSLAATYLSQKGYEVVLLERQKHPRLHVGENIIPHFWKYCDLAGVSEKIFAEGFVQKAGGMVAWKGTVRRMSFKDFGYSRPALHVERDRFDQILLENAGDRGVQVFEQVSVLGVDFGNDCETQSVIYRQGNDKTEGRISCRFVVDASGQNAVIARELGIRIVDESFRFMSLWGYFKNSKYIGFDGQTYSHEKVLDCPPMTFQSAIPNCGDWGWAWHIPLRETTSVGLILPIQVMKTAKPARESWESYFLHKCYEVPILNRLLEEAQFCPGSFAKIQDYSYRLTQVAGTGFFLIGDAAGFIDPIFSIGVPLGMYSAYIASWAIDRCLKNPSSLAQNQALFTSQLRDRYELSRSLALPGCRAIDPTRDRAKTAIQFTKPSERELMGVVSTMTTRSENFHNLIKGLPEGTSIVSKYKIIDEILFN
jgi:flavin-dependent dehydrogenase